MAQGSITKHVAKDSRVSYRARAEGGLDPASGKRRQQMKTFATKREAQTWLREQQRRAESGAWVGTYKGSLGEWITEWLAGAGARGRRESSLLTYRALLIGRVTSELGHIALVKLTSATLERFIHQQEKDLKPASVRTLYAALSVCLSDAERLDLIVANPLRKVRAPIVPRGLRPSWSPQEARSFLETLSTGEERAFWLLFLATGLRIGEVLALSWANCDLDDRQLHVRHTMTATSAGDVIGATTKTGKSRTIPLSAPIVAMLREQQARVQAQAAAYKEVWQDHDLVFPSATGKPQSDAVVRDRLSYLCTAAGVKALTPHGLRHTAASLLAERAPVSVARDVLGHSNLAMTNSYVHSTDDARRAGADTLAHLLTDF